MKTLKNFSFKKVIFTPDLLRVDENPQNKLKNTQRINVEWLYALFAKRIKENLNIDPFILCGDKTNSLFPRIEVYKELDLFINVESWAKIFEGTFGIEVLEKHLLRTFEDSLVIGFELPPYMINIFVKHNIPYIDTTIHPVRYLPDYILGVRSNIESIQHKLEVTSFREDLFVEFADISKALTVRKYRNNLPKPSSALFLGQTAVDASLIYNGKLAGLEEIRETLLNLSIKYENVYFKAHPHSKIISTLKQLTNSISNVHWYEVNIYDALGIDKFDLITSLSSGTLYEAKYFGQRTKKILPTVEKFDLSSVEDKNRLYFPVCSQIFGVEYLQYLFEKTDTFSPIFPKVWENALKSTLSMKWGK